LKEVNLDGALLNLATFNGSDLTSARLSGAILRGARLNEACLTGAVLDAADLSHATLKDANLSGANLNGAIFTGTNLTGAVLRRAAVREADLGGTILDRADLSGSDLYATSLVGTHLAGAKLNGCRVYGISAWDVTVDEKTDQSDLVITPLGQATVTVDNLEVAQFIYLMLNNEKIRDVLTTIGKKGVLILGRFSPKRKKVLDALRVKLRKLNFVPMMFDFEKVDDRSFTETIKVLAGLSRFVIADVTNPRSAPLEIQATVPDYMVPFVPILEEGEEPFSILTALQQQYDWVMSVKTYSSIEKLLAKLESRIVRPALELHKKLQLKKAQEIHIESLDDA
jgi:hypothetical protein